MKKIISFVMIMAMLFSLTACGQGEETPAIAPIGTVPEPEISSPTAAPSEASTEAATERAVPGKTLIVYFSWSSSGNTEKMANTIRTHTGGDILKIEPASAYPTDYGECGEAAKVERDENARPEIANLPDSLDAYETIFVGYPIWWHTAPMIIGTFLENYDLSGKEIYPFSQSASMDTQQFANSMDFVRTSAQGATVHDGLFADASDMDGIFAYLTENGF